MASIKFTGWVLGVTIVCLALKYSSAYGQEGSERKGKWLAAIASENHASPQNDLHDDIFATAVAKVAERKGLGARIMQTDELLKREIEEKQGSSTERSKISGQDASKKSLRGAKNSQLNAQDNGKMSQHSKRKSTVGSSYSGKAVFDEHDHESARKDDSKAFLQAADEVVNLMRKDYMGMGRPSRKPPINNHEPTD